MSLTHRQILIVFSGLVLTMLLAALDSTIVATALPTIVGELGGLTHLSWVVTAYLLAQTVVTPLYGKLGDLYGRKRVLQSAIVIFLIGSALCGLSGNMTQLIVFRAIQGLGGGGLMVTTQAVVGDIVPARERGRYQGIFGAVFGVSSIAGPLLGGFFTTHLSWRWIFYVNLPLGAVALAVLAATLPESAERLQRSIDFVGAALLAVALSAIILLTDLAGTAFAWSSPPALMLGTLGALSLAGFIIAERRAREPVLPLRLFANRAFAVAAVVGLIVGFALFGSVTYVPLFLQVVKGASPTASGLLMLPMMSGMLVTSIIVGQLISRYGRYKLFPLMGTAVMTVGLFLLSRMGPDTTMPEAAVIMLVLGLGLGMVMQVLVIAAQNAVDFADLGVATSGATLFRLVGGSLGTAALGAIFASRLSAYLSRLLPSAAAATTSAGGISPEMLARLPSATRVVYAEAFTASLSTAFLVAMAISLLGFLLTWLLPERPLRETIAAASADVGSEMAETFPRPTDDTPLPHLLRGLSRLADRDVQRRHIEGIVARAGLDLSAASAWLLLRLESDPNANPDALAQAHAVDAARLREALADLRGRKLIAEASAGDGGPPRHELTDAGCEVFDRLATARRARLAELFADWPAERHEELAALVRRLARELVPAHEGGGRSPPPSIRPLPRR
jgi:EmrB/QacA subfamily drug resistance transporter